jgi:hypothetical protein
MASGRTVQGSVPPRYSNYGSATSRDALDTFACYFVAWKIVFWAGVAQWKSEGLIIPRPWVRFPPPAPFLSCSCLRRFPPSVQGTRNGLLVRIQRALTFGQCLLRHVHECERAAEV